MPTALNGYFEKSSPDTDALARRRAQDANTWKTLLAQINNTKPETMLGFGLGKLLRGAWVHRQEKSGTQNLDNTGGDNNGQNPTVDATPSQATNQADTSYTRIAPVKGVLGNGVEMSRDVQVANNWNTPIALESFKIKQEQQQPDGKTVTTTASNEYPFDMATVQNRLSLPEMVAQAQQSMDLYDWWKNQQNPMNYMYGRN